MAVVRSHQVRHQGGQTREFTEQDDRERSLLQKGLNNHEQHDEMKYNILTLDRRGYRLTAHPWSTIIFVVDPYIQRII